MTQPLPDTWHSRDLPVLREAARAVDSDVHFTGVRMHELADATGLPADEVLLAARALEAAGYVELRMVMPPQRASRITRISADARRAVGLWPNEDTALDRLIAALEAVAANADDAETRTKARSFAAWLRDAGTAIGTGVASAVITGQLPS